jgi:hypothetical protein
MFDAASDSHVEESSPRIKHGRWNNPLLYRHVLFSGAPPANCSSCEDPDRLLRDSRERRRRMLRQKSSSLETVIAHSVNLILDGAWGAAVPGVALIVSSNTTRIDRRIDVQ